MLKKYRADRAFDGFDKDQVVELDADREWDARQIATGYLEDLEPDAQADAPEASPETAADGAPADLSATTVSDSPTVTSDAEAPATTKTSRRKATPSGESDSAAGQVGGSGGGGE